VVRCAAEEETIKKSGLYICEVQVVVVWEEADSAVVAKLVACCNFVMWYAQSGGLLATMMPGARDKP
jgi:hypothetical protein